MAPRIKASRGTEALGKPQRQHSGIFIVKIEYTTLLDLIPRESDRKELTRLSKQYYESGQTPEAADPTERATADSRRSDLLDQIIQSIQWHFRAMRRPMPTREEVAEMVKEHFQ
jgi:hypothetical protein